MKPEWSRDVLCYLLAKAVHRLLASEGNDNPSAAEVIEYIERIKGPDK